MKNMILNSLPPNLPDRPSDLPGLAKFSRQTPDMASAIYSVDNSEDIYDIYGYDTGTGSSTISKQKRCCFLNLSFMYRVILVAIAVLLLFAIILFFAIGFPGISDLRDISGKCLILTILYFLKYTIM